LKKYYPAILGLYRSRGIANCAQIGGMSANAAFTVCKFWSDYCLSGIKLGDGLLIRIW
jgi:hypothetical protein